MDITVFTTAEYASVSSDGKLSVMGIFDSIQARAFPATAPRLYLAAQFKAAPQEHGTVFGVKFQLYSPEDEMLIDLSGTGEVPGNDLGISVLMNQVVTLTNVSFPTPGYYRFVALVDDVVAAVLPFAVVEA